MENGDKYNEALERARKWYTSNTNEGYRGIFEDIFPELKESECERIRKFLIDYFSCIKSTLDDGIWKGFRIDDIIAYIERQEEQKAVWSVEDYNEIESIACHLDITDNGDMAEMLRNIRDKYYSF